jgi:hypothetical protein
MIYSPAVQRIPAHQRGEIPLPDWKAFVVVIFAEKIVVIFYKKPKKGGFHPPKGGFIFNDPPEKLAFF